jgi:hypothetical protein
MTLKFSSAASGTLLERPAAATVPGLIYHSTDTGALSVSDGAVWTAVGGGGAPAAHASTHEAGGSDDLAWTTIRQRASSKSPSGYSL